MKKIVDWINSHKILTVCIALFLFVVQPIVVHWMFKTPAATPFWENTWDAGDLLGYIAGFEAFLGTVFLGFVAVRQNDTANDLNKKLVKIQEDQGVFERQPEFYIEAQTKHLPDFSEVYKLLKCTFISKGFFSKLDSEAFDKEDTFLFLIKLKNRSDFRVIANLSTLQLSDESGAIVLEFDEMPMIFKTYPLYLDKGTEEEVAFIMKPSEINKLDNVDGTVRFTLKNPINEGFILSINFSIFGSSPIGLYLQITDYQIIRVSGK